MATFSRVHVVLGFIIILGITICTIRANGIPRICPRDYVFEPDTNQCYRLPSRDSRVLNWFAARDVCREEGGDLITASDKIKNELLLKLVRKHKLVDFMAAIWLGLIGKEVIDNMQTFEWVNGNPLVYENWGNYRPPNTSSESPECGVLVFGETRYEEWVNRSCKMAFQYICERPLDINPMCPHGYTSITKDESCVSIINGSKSFDNSRSECGTDGGDLVSVSDYQTNIFVKYLIDNSAADVPRYWVGLKAISEEYQARYHWLDGSLQESDAWNTLYNVVTDRFCGTLHRSHGFMETYCSALYPSLCEKKMTKVYPAFKCGLPSLTVVTENQELRCLRVRNRNPKDLTEANEDCKRSKFRLFGLEQNQLYHQSLITRHMLMDANQLYWSGGDKCNAFNITTGSLTAVECGNRLSFVCQYWGEILFMIDLRELASKLNENVMVSMNSMKYQFDISFRSYFCNVTSESKIIRMYNWPWTDLLHVDINNEYTSCGNSSDLNECCVEVWLTNPEFHSTYFYMDTSLTMDKYHCLCPENTENATTPETPTSTSENPTSTAENPTFSSENPTFSSENLTSTAENPTFSSENPTFRSENPTSTAENPTFRSENPTSTIYNSSLNPATPIDLEAFDLLRNMTAPKNDSVSPNNLCPCQCNRTIFDLNPSPEVLGQILFKIQQELKVEPEKLSSKRNKKISAVDSRAESKAIGYVGILMCLMPILFIVAFDLCRIFQQE